jgi:hypothetical protein
VEKERPSAFDWVLWTAPGEAHAKKLVPVGEVESANADDTLEQELGHKAEEELDEPANALQHSVAVT